MLNLNGEPEQVA